MKKKVILLTGASGNMGKEGLKKLLEHPEYMVRVLVLPEEADSKFFKLYQDRIQVCKGDLVSFADVKKAVEGTDIVLHVGALVSPLADRTPDLAWKVNFEGTKNIVDAILEREDRDRVRLLYIGTVAESGNRAAPVHWGRIGDPLVPSIYDFYALSKIAAERYVIESGLKHWISLRQTGILHKNIIQVNDGTGYHAPLNGCLEWVSAEDSGRLLANICEDKAWNSLNGNCYNIGGGAPYRLTGYQFMDRIFRMVGVSIQDIYQPNMFALRNFHGQFFLDSDELEEKVHFREQSLDEILMQIWKQMPSYMRLMRFLPKEFVKIGLAVSARSNPLTPLYWVNENVDDRVTAYLKSKKHCAKNADWSSFILRKNLPCIILDHGYDESKKDSELTIQDMKEAAAFRGGVCLSNSMNAGDLTSRLRWRCAEGHEFYASPFLVLKTGHWCSECLNPPWNFDRQAANNPFMAQIWYADHKKTEQNIFTI